MKYENQVILGDSREVLKTFPDECVDSVVTDPPGGIEFMGREWDRFSEEVDDPNPTGPQTATWSHRGGVPFDRIPTPRFQGKTKASLQPFQDFMVEVFLEVLRVLKFGGHAVVWSIPRTSHHTAMALERAGFEIRDCIYNVKDRSAEVQAFLATLTSEQQELLLRAGPADGWILR